MPFLHNFGLCFPWFSFVDSNLPTIVCPQTTQQTFLSGGQTSTTVPDVATASDSEGMVTVSYNPNTVSATGLTLVTATATDEAGNIASCTFLLNAVLGKKLLGICQQNFNDSFCNTENNAATNDILFSIQSHVYCFICVQVIC